MNKSHPKYSEIKVVKFISTQKKSEIVVSEMINSKMMAQGGHGISKYFSE